MSNPAWVAQTEQRIAEIASLQESIAELQNELQLFHEQVRKEIASLRKDAEPEAAVSAPEAPAPAPTRQFKVRPVVPANLPRSAIDEEIDELQAAEGGGEPEAPEEPAVGGRPVSVMISNGMADSEPEPGWIIDRPSGGLRILVDEPIKAGTVLTLRATKEHPQNQWTTVSVRTCRPERNSYVVLVHFIERPPWGVMNLLNGT
jgi:hypothetical protein